MRQAHFLLNRPRRRTRHVTVALGGCLVLAAAVAVAQTAGPEQARPIDAVLQSVFGTPEFAGKYFGPARWVKGGDAYLTLEPSGGSKTAKEIAEYETATGRRTVLVGVEKLIPKGWSKPLEIESYEGSGDFKRLLIFTNSRRVWRANTRGDYWVLDLDSGGLLKLGGGAPASSLMFAHFSPDGTKVAYVREHNLYIEDVRTAAVTPLTSDGSPTIINGTTDWVYEEEFFLREAYRWSPDGRSIAYWQFDTSAVGGYPLVYDTGGHDRILTRLDYPQFGLYPKLLEYAFPEAGTGNSAVRVGVVAAEGGSTRWIAVPGDPRNNYIPRMEWTQDSKALVLEHLNRLQNTDDVLIAEALTGRVRTLFTDRDQAWVDIVYDYKWLDGGKELLWTSEQDGWRHISSISLESGAAHVVTSGAFDVISVEGADPKGEWLYYLASPTLATERYLFRTRLDGMGTPERLSPENQAGTHGYQISPNFDWAFHTFSTFDSPPVTELVELPGHGVRRVLEDNAALRAKLKELEVPPAEFLRADIGGGVALDGWLMKPPNFDTSKRYPLLVFIYGEPAGQTVVNGWTGQTALFHRAVARDGYLVASFDNCGTPAPKGRAWRKIIYGSVGVLSSKEQAAALEWLERSRSYVDSTRVAVWGWSGGGTNTLNLIFRSPDLYKVGMAVAPVPDQRLYDSVYQERYMGLPQDNPDGYREGSAINFAEGLKGRLLIVHGSGDDNVHFQGTELLVNRLIELGKSFDFMVYPGRTHAIIEGPGTRLHLYQLLARYLEEHLPQGPR